ncbi:MAG: hypothetical protein CLLPBCKN_003807 [Chroococcidiopsis cubana SAG 39.79]|uniref:Uncharacterized protein n=1 Tax=Chroococcidiopsis cubana SAG 39.79 TaxID=388085 RepID=A0AB37URN5_9CYAN|nr:hypothetical protein [Chroococcidiopsis cubana SAG 39.79]RUT13995.1 hypothetical protein DSM107010_08950 [Chroococcidiopsis cubana SAG 39.79]
MLKFQPVLPYRCIVLAMHGFQPLLELKTFKVPIVKANRYLIMGVAIKVCSNRLSIEHILID